MGRDCRFRIVEASRDNAGNALLSERDAQKLINEVKDAAQKKVKEGVDLDDAIIDEIAERQITASKEREIQKRNALKNLTVRNEITNKVEGFISEGLNVRQSLQAALVGINGLYNGGRKSVDNKIKTVHRQYLGEFIRDLEDQDLLGVLNSKTQQLEIEKELWEISNDTGKAGVTGSKQAKAIAEIYHKHSEAMRARLNQAGADISKIDNFSITQTHNRTKMRKDGYEAWRDNILPLLDRDKTFNGEDAEDFLKSSYDVLTTGISKKQTEPSDKLFEFKGPQNLAKKVSQHRVLHFKDADSSHTYRMEFGTRDLSEGMTQLIDTNARNIGLLEELGTNPKAMIDGIIDDLQKKYRGEPEKVMTDLDERRVRNFYSELSLESQIPESPTLATVGSVSRALQSLSKLGGALISSITDLPVKAVELQNQGRGIFESYGITVSDIARGVTDSKQKKQVATSLGVGFDGMAGDVAARFTAVDDLPASMSKLQRLFFKLNGLQWWTDANKRGTGLAMANHLAQLKTSKFNDLDDDIQRLFTNFEISKDDWELIRKSAVQEVDGNEYITPDAIRLLDDSLFGKGAAQKKQILEDKLRGYIVDRVDFATLTPSAREQAILNQGLSRGSVSGEVIRSMMQFKSFPVTVLTKLYGNLLYGKGKADIPAMAQTIIMMTALGYAAMSAKDLVKGRKPRSLSEKGTWAAAFTQGGGLGIMGDFILGDFNRFGQTFTTTLVGPTGGTIDDIAKLYSAARDGDDTAAKSLNFLINNAPFANLFYLRPALNHMMLYQMQEAVNPGYLRRMERRIERENNQEFLIKPSSAL